MSEYWISKKKYICRYCDIFIADDAPSRQQHENGLRHQGNKARYVHNLYKNSERKKKDLEEEMREMKRVEQAASAAYAKDMGLDPNATPPPVPSSSRTAATPAPKPSDPYSNYSTAASLGYVDEEGEKLAAETALRQTEGRAGNWVTVPVPVLHSTPSTAEPSLLEQAAPLEDPDDVRTWKFDGTDTKRRRIAVGMGNIYNPGKLNVIRKEHQKKEEDSENSVKAEEVLPLPKWTPKTWSRPGQGCGSSSSSALVQDSPGAGSDEGVPSAETGSMAAKTEDSKSLIGEQFGEASPPSAGIKTEEALDEPPPHTPTSSAMFRKRKRPGVSAGTRA